MVKRKELTPEETGHHKRLRALWDSRHKALGVTQEKVAEAMGVSQGAISHYLNGFNALNIEAAMWFARFLKCHPAELMPSINKLMPMLDVSRDPLLDDLIKKLCGITSPALRKDVLKSLLELTDQAIKTQSANFLERLDADAKRRSDKAKSNKPKARAT